MALHKNNNTLTHRLAAVVERVGGKRAMANATLISEAQLFRYVNGATDIPAEKLLAVAVASKVDAGWLLTGDGEMTISTAETDIRPSFRADLMVQVIQMFEELLIESDKSFTPRQRAFAATLIYEALRIEETRSMTTVNVDKRMTPYYPDFLAPLRSDNRMEDYLNTMKSLEYGLEVSEQSLKQFDALVKLGNTSAFEGAMGEIYFDKMGTTLLPEAAKTLLKLVEYAAGTMKKSKIDWLDAGCGNGRHLAFLAQNCPHLRLHGFDMSKQAVNLCQKMVRSGKLPVGIVQEADFRSIPYENESLDIVYCRAGLHMMPYVPNSTIGAVQFMTEAKRVLRPGGMMLLLTPEGTARDYVNFIQYYSAHTIQALADEVGLKVLEIQNTNMNETGGVAGKDYSSKLNRGLQVFIQKPLVT